MYEILFKWGLDTLREVAGDVSKEELAFALEAVKTKNAFVVRRFDEAREACEELVDLSIRVDGEIKILQDEMQSVNENERYAKFIGKVRNDLHPAFLREFRKLKGRFIVTNDLLSAYSLISTEIVQYRQFEFISKSLSHSKISESASLYRALWEHLVHLLSTMTRISSSDVRFWLTDNSYMRTAELFAARELEFAKYFFVGASHGYYHCILEEPDNIKMFWDNSTDSIINTYEQPSPTSIAMDAVVRGSTQF